MKDDDPPPLHLGDHPDGVYWSAIAPEVDKPDAEDDDVVDGSDLRIMWDEGAGPLWAGGLLPADPEWLCLALGLDRPLVDDLLEWSSDMTALRLGPPVDDWTLRVRSLDERGEELATRVRTQVGSRFSVSYQP